MISGRCTTLYSNVPVVGIGCLIALVKDFDEIPHFLMGRIYIPVIAMNSRQVTN